MKYLFLSVLIASLVGVMFVPNVFGEYVPDWVKNTAGWWADDKISETEFVNAVEFLVKENIIQVDVVQTSETSQGVPGWVKNTAGWWATDVISETEFVNAVAYLIENGIISIESSKSPELIAEMWVNGDINDDEFLANVNQLIEKGIITVKSDSITKTSTHPDWLVNNAGWWAARILTNSDFNFDPGYLKEEIYPCTDLRGTFHHKNSIDQPNFSIPGLSIGEQGNSWCAHPDVVLQYNSYGFRGDEFQEQKHDIDFRIFAVGGSTTYGSGVTDDETWPAYLQQIINEKIIGKKIEVINAGIPGADTRGELKAIKQKLAKLSPDLIIMFDGWNDLQHYLPTEKTIQNWESVCKLGNDLGFDTIIIVQPMAISDGQRIPTEQEIQNFSAHFRHLETSQQYTDAFEELDKVCTKTADLGRTFDYVQEPIFYDSAHYSASGNKIIAENVFSVISPIYFGETHSVIHDNLYSENNEPETGVVYAVGSDLSNKNFDNLNLQDAVFDKADLSNTSFKNANIDGARFMFANLSNSNLLDRTDLSNINLTGIDLSNMNLQGKNLTGTTLVQSDFAGSILTGADLSTASLTYADLTNTNLTGTNLSDTNLYKTDLSEVDLRDTTFTNADFRATILHSAKVPDSILTDNDFEHATLKNIDLSGKDLSFSNFHYAHFDNSNLEGANLQGATLIQVDFTKVKNKSLAGANLFDTSLAHSFLSGVNLTDTILKGTNFWKADLSGQDFTVIADTSADGITFVETNLSNSNFEGVDMSPQQIFYNIFKDKAYLVSGSFVDGSLKDDLFGKFSHILILSGKVNGNDLVVSYVFFNSFAQANLENANFKNAKLWHTNFYLANLTNADLSGADLRKAFIRNADFSNANLSNANLSNANLDGVNLSDANLEGANLSNANLSGANLSGAIWDESTILKCKNHPICLND